MLESHHANVVQVLSDPRLLEAPLTHRYNESIVGGIAVAINLCTPPIAGGPLTAHDLAIEGGAQAGQLLIWIRLSFDRGGRDAARILALVAEDLRKAVFVEEALERKVPVNLRLRFQNTGDFRLTMQ